MAQCLNGGILLNCSCLRLKNQLIPPNLIMASGGSWPRNLEGSLAIAAIAIAWCIDLCRPGHRCADFAQSSENEHVNQSLNYLFPAT